MKIYQSSSDYPSYSLPTVSLAYFLRYPNPKAPHVLSTDVLSQHVDANTGRLHTVRLHLKRSKVPAAVAHFLPKAMIGADGKSQTYILEKSTIDIKEGWMQTETRNMEWTGVLSVVEKQMYKDNSKFELKKLDGTSCQTTVTFVSKLGETIRKRRRLAQENGKVAEDEDEQPKQGWFASWSTAGIQRTIELVGVKRTKTAVYNSSEGMKIVLERLRNGGIKGVLEGMRHDRMLIAAGGGMTSASEYEQEAPVWKQVWQQGQQSKAEHDDEDGH